MAVEAQKGPSSSPDPKGKDPSAEGGGTGAKSLEELLASWDREDEGEKGSKDEGGKGAEKPSAAADRYEKRLRALEEREAERIYKIDIGQVIEEVKADLDIDPLIVEAWVNRRADEQPKLRKLWDERDARKSEFQAAIKAMRPEFAAWAKERNLSGGKRDDQSASRRLVSALKGARDADAGSGASDVDFSSLSDAEFSLKKAEIFRLAQAGKLR